MMIRGGGNPNTAMAAMPLREWTRRLGALPAEAYDCFMVRNLGFTEYKRGSRLIAGPMAGSPRIVARLTPDRWQLARALWRGSNKRMNETALDKVSPIQAVCIKVHVRICAGGAG
jgi:hypothetical protein